MAIRTQNITLCDFCKDSFPLIVARYEDGDFYQLVGRVSVVEREAGRAAFPANRARAGPLVVAEPLNEINRVLLYGVDAVFAVPGVPFSPVLKHLLPVINFPFFG